jgi:hypothetical protein
MHEKSTVKTILMVVIGYRIAQTLRDDPAIRGKHHLRSISAFL